MKKLLFLLLLIASTGILRAYDFQVDSLCYNILRIHTNVVEVTCSSLSNNYFGLTHANIPDSVTFQGTTYRVVSIGKSAFEGCSSLTYVTFPGCVISIGSSAFKGCSSLTSITIPNRVKKIRSSAFEGCSSLTSISIPNNVTSIEEKAFKNCIGLTSVTIPNSVTHIEGSAFSLCSNLTSIAVAAGNTTYDSRDSCNAIIETATNHLIIGCQNTTIPNSVTSIGKSAFYGCTGLTSVSIPTSVTSIENGAFANCSGLTSMTVEAGNTVYDSRNNCNAIIETGTNTLIAGCQGTTIPSNVTSIGYMAFIGCSSLTSISIPNSVTKIGDFAFEGCSGLTSITIPNGVTKIGDYAFAVCSGLAYIVCETATPPVLGMWVFYHVNKFTPLYVPVGSIEYYRRGVCQWKDFTNIQAIPGTDTIDFPNAQEPASNSVSEACVVFKGKIFNSNRLSPSTMVSPDFELGARFENDTICQADYRIVSFDLVIYNKTYSSDSNKLTDEQKAIIKKLRMGSSILVSAIVAQGPDDKQYNLKPMKLIVN